MDLSEFKNVSADNYLKYTVCDQNVDYDKNIIITTGKYKNSNENFIQRFEVFENIDRTSKMVFESKVLVYFNNINIQFHRLIFTLYRLKATYLMLFCVI